MKKLPALAFIGSGNTAWCLATAFHSAGYPISGVASRNAKTGKALARQIQSKFKNITELIEEADICFICVQDRYISEVVSSMPTTKNLVVHCSGSAPLIVLKGLPNIAVFYPVISMRSGRKMSFDAIPVCIEASKPSGAIILKQLGNSLGARVVKMTSEQRQQLHLAAVFVNNFSNACFTAAEDITNDAGIPFSLLQPLLRESLELLEKHPPSKNQTGPARRNDTIILRRHLSLLKEQPSRRKLYKVLSEYIRERFS